ncbi:MAG: DUF2256 domain-containing protein [Pseudomonadota bacterium]|nr:DUF2256 domain-containing protein [Pseudomonadota bacterium]
MHGLVLHPSFTGAALGWHITKKVRCSLAKHRKTLLPQRICKTCAKPFAWRKKWARDWDQVLYCSERCRRSKHHSASGGEHASVIDEQGSGAHA